MSTAGRRERSCWSRHARALLEAGIDAENANRLVGWMKEYILFHGRRRPQEMGMPEIQEYLGGQPFRDGRWPGDRAEAERSLRFLYEKVLKRQWPARQDGRVGKVERKGVRNRCFVSWGGLAGEPCSRGPVDAPSDRSRPRRQTAPWHTATQSNQFRFRLGFVDMLNSPGPAGHRPSRQQPFSGTSPTALSAAASRACRVTSGRRVFAAAIRW